MDVSEKRPVAGQSGQDLLDTVASLTGLPEGLVQDELHELLSVAGQNAGEVTLDGLRQAMLLYLDALVLQDEELSLADAAELSSPSSGGIPSA